MNETMRNILHSAFKENIRQIMTDRIRDATFNVAGMNLDKN